MFKNKTFRYNKTTMTNQELRSEHLFKDAQDILVGGVNSPVRAFKAVGKYPL